MSKERGQRVTDGLSHIEQKVIATCAASPWISIEDELPEVKGEERFLILNKHNVVSLCLVPEGMEDLAFRHATHWAAINLPAQPGGE